MAKIVLDPESFKVLASDTRIQILKSLDQRAKTVSELSRELDLNKATVFEHLQQLVKGELVKKKDKDGRKWVYYTLTYKGTSLLHPETTTFMVLFSLSALGGLGAIWQLGNWLTWWAFPGGGEGDGLHPTGGQEEGAGADQANDTQAEADDNAPEGASSEGSEGSFFDFLGETGFWIFIALLALCVALFVTGYLVRRRAFRRTQFEEHLQKISSENAQ